MKYIFLLIFIIKYLYCDGQATAFNADTVNFPIPPSLENNKDALINFTVNVKAEDYKGDQGSKLIRGDVVIYIGEVYNLINLEIKAYTEDRLDKFEYKAAFSHISKNQKHFLVKGKDKYEVTEGVVTVPGMFPNGRKLHLEAKGHFKNGENRYLIQE